MFEDLGMMLGGDPSALAGMFQGLGGNPLEMLMRVSNDPAMREAFLNRAAASPVSPNVFSQPGGMPGDAQVALGGMVPTGQPGGMMPTPPMPMLPPGSAPDGRVPAGPTAGFRGVPQSPTPPYVAEGANPQSPYFEFGVSPDVAAQIQTNLPTSAEYKSATSPATPPLGQLLAGAQSAMKDDRKRNEPPQQPRPAVAGGAAHGSVNRNQAPNYLPVAAPAAVDPTEMRRRATLAALLGGGR